MKNLDPSQERAELEVITKILKQKLILMMIQKWNITNFPHHWNLETMADDIIEIIAEMGNKNG